MWLTRTTYQSPTERGFFFECSREKWKKESRFEDLNHKYGSTNQENIHNFVNTQRIRKFEISSIFFCNHHRFCCWKCSFLRWTSIFFYFSTFIFWSEREFEKITWNVEKFSGWKIGIIISCMLSNFDATRYQSQRNYYPSSKCQYMKTMFFSFRIFKHKKVSE